MKTGLKILKASLICLIILGPSLSQAESFLKGSKADIQCNTKLDSRELTITGSLDDKAEVNAGMLLMREEEKLAHDLYVNYLDLYGMRIFSNISSAETNHMAAMFGLLQDAGLEDPANAEAGVFTNDHLQQVYDKLLSAGKTSLVEALKCGAYVEELDIQDLEKQLSLTTNETIKQIYSNLLRGSRNHLRAFNRVLESSGVDYKPQLLNQESFDEIIGAAMERCGPKMGRGQGCGRGCKN